MMKRTMLALLLSLGFTPLAGAVDTSVTVNEVVQAGVSVTSYTYNLSTSVNYVLNNDGRVVLWFTKTGAGACTVTITTEATFQGLAVSDLTVTIPATTGHKMLGPFPPTLFNNANSSMTFTLSDTTGLSFAAHRF